MCEWWGESICSRERDNHVKEKREVSWCWKRDSVPACVCVCVCVSVSSLRPLCDEAATAVLVGKAFLVFYYIFNVFFTTTSGWRLLCGFSVQFKLWWVSSGCGVKVIWSNNSVQCLNLWSEVVSVVVSACNSYLRTTVQKQYSAFVITTCSERH